MKKLLVLTALLMLAAAADASVSLSFGPYMPTYTSADEISIGVVLKNNGAAGNFILTSYIQSDTASVGSSPVSVEDEIAAGQEIGIRVYQENANNLLDGRYTLTASVRGEDGVNDQKSIDFQVQGVAKRPQFTIKVCKDEACKQPLSYMIVGEKVWLKVESADSIKAAVKVIAPGGSASDLTPPAQYTPTKEGTYSMKVTVTGAGIKSTEQTTQVPALAKEPSLTVTQSCNEDGVCDAGENPTNCPQDCVRQTTTTTALKGGQQSGTKGCLPLLLAPLSLLVGIAARILRI